MPVRLWWGGFVVRVGDGGTDEDGMLLVVPELSTYVNGDGDGPAVLFGAGSGGGGITLERGNGTSEVVMECLLEHVEAALRAVVVAPVGDFYGTMSVNVTVSDGGVFGAASGAEAVAADAGGVLPATATLSGSAELTVVVTAANDAPEVMIVSPDVGVGARLVVSEGGRSSVGDIDIDVTDATDLMASSAVLSVVIRVGEGTEEGSGGNGGSEGVLYVGYGASFGSGVGDEAFVAIAGLGCTMGNMSAEAGCVEVVGNGTGEVVLRGFEGVLSAALGSLVFEPVALYFGVSVVNVELSDLGNEDANAGQVHYANVTFEVNVTDVNHAPTLTIDTDPAAFVTDEDVGSAVGLLDVTSSDAVDGVPNAIVEYRVIGDNGAFVEVDGSVSEYATLLSGGGVTIVSGGGEDGDGGASVSGGAFVFRCTIGASVDVFEAVRVRGAVDFSGSVTVTVSVDDLGSGGGVASSLTASDTIVLTVEAVADAPVVVIDVVGGAGWVIDEETTTSAGDFNVSVTDVDSPGGQAFAYTVSVDEGAMVIVGSGETGAMQLLVSSGVVSPPISSSGDAVLAFSMTADRTGEVFDLLTIVPASEDYHGTITVTVAVDDNGDGLGSPGEVGTGTTTIVVNAVNDAPTISVGGVAGDVGGWSIMEGEMSSYGDLVVTSSDAADGVPDAMLAFNVSVDEGATIELNSGDGAYTASLGNGDVTSAVVSMSGDVVTFMGRLQEVGVCMVRCVLCR